MAKLKKDPTVAYAPLRDSHAPSAEQRTQLDAISADYNAKADEALAPLRNWEMKQGRRIFDRDLGQRLRAAQKALNKLNAEYGRKAQDVLTAEQLTRFKESTARKDR